MRSLLWMGICGCGLLANVAWAGAAEPSGSAATHSVFQPALRPLFQAAPTPRLLLPMARINIGPLMALRPETVNDFSLQLQGGLLFGWPGTNTLERLFVPTLWLLPELGYDFRRLPSGAGHLMALGAGVGYGNLMFVLGMYGVKLVAGKAEDQSAIGVRHGVQAHFLATIVNVSFEHQMIYFGETLHQELLLSVGVNLAGVLFQSRL